MKKNHLIAIVLAFTSAGAMEPAPDQNPTPPAHEETDHRTQPMGARLTTEYTPTLGAGSMYALPYASSPFTAATQASLYDSHKEERASFDEFLLMTMRFADSLNIQEATLQQVASAAMAIVSGHHPISSAFRNHCDDYCCTEFDEYFKNFGRSSDRLGNLQEKNLFISLSPRIPGHHYANNGFQIYYDSQHDNRCKPKSMQAYLNQFFPEPAPYDTTVQEINTEIFDGQSPSQWLENFFKKQDEDRMNQNNELSIQKNHSIQKNYRAIDDLMKIIDQIVNKKTHPHTKKCIYALNKNKWKSLLKSMISILSADSISPPQQWIIQNHQIITSFTSEADKYFSNIDQYCKIVIQKDTMIFAIYKTFSTTSKILMQSLMNILKKDASDNVVINSTPSENLVFSGLECYVLTSTAHCIYQRIIDRFLQVNPDLPLYQKTWNDLCTSVLRDAQSPETWIQENTQWYDEKGKRYYEPRNRSSGPEKNLVSFYAIWGQVMCSKLEHEMEMGPQLATNIMDDWTRDVTHDLQQTTSRLQKSIAPQDLDNRHPYSPFDAIKHSVKSLQNMSKQQQ